jgi:hypothetical protein
MEWNGFVSEDGKNPRGEGPRLHFGSDSMRFLAKPLTYINL